MKERGSDHGRGDAFPVAVAGRSNTAAAVVSRPAAASASAAATHRSPPHRSLPPATDSFNSRGTARATSRGDHQQQQGFSPTKGLYRKLFFALLIGFYLGVTVTVWFHAWHTADSHIQQLDQGKGLGLIPPHALDWSWQQQHQTLGSSTNCSETIKKEKGQVEKVEKTKHNTAHEHIQKQTKPTSAPSKRPAPPPKAHESTNHHQAAAKQPPPPKQTVAEDAKKQQQQPHVEQSLPTSEERAKVRQILQQSQQRQFLPLQAIVETPTLSNLANRDNNYTYSKPLQLRTSSSLETFTYFQNVHSCQDLPNGWPVDHPQELDNKFGPIVGDLGTLYDKRMEYAKYFCPVDADPFLPWIHDVFPTADGHFVEFIAHNKRRCRQDPSMFREDIDNLEPQVALLQSVPVQRVSKKQIDAAGQTAIPAEWKNVREGEYRYRLSSIEEADNDGKETRFICQFHTLKPTNDDSGGVQKILVGETLSVYPYNYEHANYQHRKGQKPNPMLTRPEHDTDIIGLHNEQIWNAILHFRCPVPDHLQKTVAEGSSVDTTTGIPSLYVDVVPIRTPPREGRDGYNPYHLDVSTFDPEEEWGSMHILPPVEQSGRWANVPICPSPVSKSSPTAKEVASAENKRSLATANDNGGIKTNYLVGCLWASAAFSTRGEDNLDTSTSHRLLEWLTYHLEVAGFDKMIVYDNTEAFTNRTSLQSVTDLFPGRVERIPWKHRVCNNNRPTHPNAGERSSQYAAEASCRIRYGPTTEWMISFDTDEYLVPQGKHTSIRQWLQGLNSKKTHVLNFYQIRALLNKRFTARYYDDSKDCRVSCKSCYCLAKLPNTTFFESFCDPTRFPRPEWTGRAKKQLYQPNFVLNHFVHYAAVTKMIIDQPSMPRVVGYPYERRVDESTEAFMLHTKTKAPRRTKSWQTKCKEDANSCPIGIPWPHYQDDNVSYVEGTKNDDGFVYTCWESRKIHGVLANKLRHALEPFEKKWTAPVIASRTPSVVTASTPLSTKKVPPASISGNHEEEIISIVGGERDPTIRDFEPGLPAVIATKIQGNSTLLQLEQSLCLLKHAYNDRLNYDIVVFAATPITDDEVNILKAAAAPAKLTVALDNPGLQTMVAALGPKELEYLLERCNVTKASELTWRTRCLETSSAGTTNMPIQYTWQAEFRSLHLWKHPAIARYKYMMWLDSDGFCTRVRTGRIDNCYAWIARKRISSHGCRL